MRPLILFDMDGTLLNSVPAIGEAATAPWRKTAFRSTPSPPITAWSAMVCASSSAGPAPPVPPRNCGKRFSPPMTASTPRNATNPASSTPASRSCCKDSGPRAFLPLVITNKPQPQADALRESTFHGMLDAIWGQREGFPLKPDPTLAQELIRELEAHPVAYVGDSQVDISLGKNLGLPTVLMTWGSRTPAELLAADPSAILADTAAQLEARLEQYLADLQ